MVSVSRLAHLQLVRRDKKRAGRRLLVIVIMLSGTLRRKESHFKIWTHTDITTASISGISSKVHGGAGKWLRNSDERYLAAVNVRVYRLGPKNEVGPHLLLNTGSNSILIPLPLSEFRLGNSTRKHACPNQVAVILSIFSISGVSPPNLGGLGTTKDEISFGIVGKLAITFGRNYT